MLEPIDELNFTYLLETVTFSRKEDLGRQGQQMSDNTTRIPAAHLSTRTGFKLAGLAQEVSPKGGMLSRSIL